MLFRTRCHRFLYQLAFRIDFRVCLVAVEFLSALLRPASVGVLVPLLVGLFLLIFFSITFFLIPKFITAAFLDGLVSLTGVSLNISKSTTFNNFSKRLPSEPNFAVFSSKSNKPQFPVRL